MLFLGHKETYVEEIPATGHAWGEPTYAWSEDHSACTATRICANDATHSETATAKVTSEITKEATETEEGSRTYTASFVEIWAATQTYTENIPVVNHTVASGDCGDDLTWTLDDNGILTISGTGAMWDNERKSPWCNFDITTAVIEMGVTSIGGLAFDDCSLTSVAIPNSVTSIGYYAFIDCSSLTSVTIPNSVTSIDEGAFYGCSGLMSVTIPDSVTTIGDCAFSDTLWYNNLTDPSGFVVVGDSILLKYCGTDSEVTIPQGIKVIGYEAFWDGSLTSVTIPDSVTSIGNGTFCGCISLTSVALPDSVMIIGDYTFDSCSNLANITIPSSVTSIGDYAFTNCAALTDIYYCGTEEQWNTVSKNGADMPKTATVHFTKAPEELDDFAVSVPAAMSSSVTITAPEGGWAIGKNTFTVESEKACILLVTNDGGQTYTRLQATANGDGHAFTADLTADSSIVCARKGDISGDGTISALEARQILMAGNGLFTLTPLQKMIADTNGDGTISALEARQILMAGNGLFTIGW